MRLPILLFLTILPLHATIFRVDSSATGTNDGSSWANAFDNLEDALRFHDPSPPTEVWVAKGIYYPDEGGANQDNDKQASFHTKTGLILLGGFSGSEISSDQRVPLTNPTILSGDLEQDDIDPDGDGLITRSEDLVGVCSNAAIYLSSGVENALIDGFIFTAGSGVSAFNAEGTISNCRFLGGKTGIYGSRCTLNVRDCLFSFLTEACLSGSRDSILNIERCHFTETTGPCVFTSSTSISTNITNCRFEKLCYPGFGRGRCIEHKGDGTLTLRSSLILGGTLVSASEAMIRVDSPSETGIFNCTFAGSNLPTLINTDATPGALTFTNNIVWSTAGAPQVDHPSATMTHCLIRNESPAGVGNLNGLAAQNDPNFVDPANGDYRLADGSPAVNAGDNSVVVETTDLQGAPRIVAIVNLGAFEIPKTPSPKISNFIYDGPSQTVTLALSFYPDAPFVIESSSDMAHWNFLTFTSSNPIGNSIFTFAAPAERTFYRLVEPQ